MSFFIDKKTKKRKSPAAVYAFALAVLFLCVFGALYWSLAEFLYANVYVYSETVSTLLHALLISILGTAICCLAFFLPDKRMVPLGFVGLGVILGMFCAAIPLLEADARMSMLRLVLLFGLGPVAVGNAVTWPVYRVFRRRAAAKRAAASAVSAPKPLLGAAPSHAEEAPAAPPRDGRIVQQEEAALFYEDPDEPAEPDSPADGR